MPGKEVVVTIRSVPGAAQTCLSIMDVDLTMWADTCGPNETRRITFVPRRTGRHYAALSSGNEFLHLWGSAEFCVIGEESDCP